MLNVKGRKLTRISQHFLCILNLEVLNKDLMTQLQINLPKLQKKIINKCIRKDSNKKLCYETIDVCQAFLTLDQKGAYKFICWWDYQRNENNRFFMALFHSPSSFGGEDPPSPWKLFTEAKDHIDQNMIIKIRRIWLINELMNEN